MDKINVIAVVGPTASGKTALGIELAKYYGGEIVSADSMQVYRGMDIATAKPSTEEMQGIAHHLMGFLDRDQAFSVADYTTLAGERISDIHSRGKQPIIVGGTGLYIDSLLENINFPDIKRSDSLRRSLEEYASREGSEALFERLRKCDPETAAVLHPNNLVRVIRAIEVFELTSRKISELKAESRRQETPYKTAFIGLTYRDRQKLYDRINRRVDLMAEAGLEEEARQVYESGQLKTACNAIGYKELVPYFRGECTFEESIEKIKLETRRYAKRQLTWFRKNAEIKWVMLDEFDNKEKILDFCKKNIAKCFSM